VELHALPGRQAHGAVGQVGDPVEGQPLLAGQPATGDGGAHHAGVVEGQALGPPRLADVAIVLLVDAVELEQHDAVVLELGGGRRQLVGERATQVAAGPLDVLDAHPAQSTKC
jgi:hypothetical protein